SAGYSNRYVGGGGVVQTARIVPVAGAGVHVLHRAGAGIRARPERGPGLRAGGGGCLPVRPPTPATTLVSVGVRAGGPRARDHAGFPGVVRPVAFSGRQKT